MPAARFCGSGRRVELVAIVRKPHRVIPDKPRSGAAPGSIVGFCALRWIPELRCAPSGMTRLVSRKARHALGVAANRQSGAAIPLVLDGEDVALGEFAGRGIEVADIVCRARRHRACCARPAATSPGRHGSRHGSRDGDCSARPRRGCGRCRRSGCRSGQRAPGSRRPEGAGDQMPSVSRQGSCVYRLGSRQVISAEPRVERQHQHQCGSKSAPSGQICSLKRSSSRVW